jgi:hypothetical protein
LIGGNVSHGDMYYDLAKLRHNIIFNNGLFEVNEIKVDLKQLEDFDKFILEKNKNINFYYLVKYVSTT